MKLICAIRRERIPVGLFSSGDISRLKEINRRADKLSNGYVFLTVENIKKPRTTGKHSQNRCINGYIQQICMEGGFDFDDVKMFCKRKALGRGYPFKQNEYGHIVYTIETGDPVPASETEINTEEAGYFIEAIQQVAAELGIILKDE